MASFNLLTRQQFGFAAGLPCPTSVVLFFVFSVESVLLPASYFCLFGRCMHSSFFFAADATASAFS